MTYTFFVLNSALFKEKIPTLFLTNVLYQNFGSVGQCIMKDMMEESVSSKNRHGECHCAVKIATYHQKTNL